MIEAHLGETIDIHAGGLDLIFPHHENEMPRAAALMAARRWPITGCTTAFSRWPTARRCRSRSATSSRPAELLEQGGKAR